MAESGKFDFGYGLRKTVVIEIQQTVTLQNRLIL